MTERSDLPPLGKLSIDQKAGAVGAQVDALAPGWLCEVLYEPDVHLRKCMEAFQKRPPTWLRISKSHEQDVLGALARSGIEVSRHQKIPGAAAVSGSSALQSMNAGIKSRYEIQDLASQCVGLLCNPKPGELWWDVCAGSGGKTLHLADLMAKQGTLLATDVRESALEELRRRAKKASAGIVRIGELDPVQKKFDGVLIDAPCSGIGAWSRNPDARWRTSVDDVRARARVQAELLRKSAENVRPGGRLVYAVCTITSMETIDVIDAFLRERGDFALEEAPHPLTKRAGGGTFWIWPWDGPCDGMFAAVIRRS
jgi:16S rRNA (cytosine967-C5)-methyltransferase